MRKHAVDRILFLHDDCCFKAVTVKWVTYRNACKGCKYRYKVPMLHGAG